MPLTSSRGLRLYHSLPNKSQPSEPLAVEVSPMKPLTRYGAAVAAVRFSLVRPLRASPSTAQKAPPK